MDEQQPTPSDTPGYQAKREEVAAHRMPPGGGDTNANSPVEEQIELTPEPAAAEVDPGASLAASNDSGAPQPPADVLPGDAAPTPLVPIPLAPAAAPTTTVTPNAVIIRPPAVAAAAAAPKPRGGQYALWMLVWVAIWSGAMSLKLDHRFDRTMDWNTSYFSVAARNLVREGFVKLRGGMYLNAGEFGIKKEFYAGHPPLTAWMLAGWMKLFGPMGQNDAIIRALPLAFTALNLILLYALVRRLLGPPAALATTIICSLLPMTAYYGQVVNMEPFVVTFILLASLAYVRWARTGSKFAFVVLCISVILGCWTDWPMYIFTGLLAVAHFFRRRDLLPSLPPAPGMPAGEYVKPGPPVLSTLFLIVLPLAMFALFLLYMKLNDAPFSDLSERATERMTAKSDAAAPATILAAHHDLFEKFKDCRKLKEWFIDLFTPAALLLAALGALSWVKWSRQLATDETTRRAAFKILFCLILMQLIYTLAFPQGASVHEFWQYYLILPVAILAGAFCTWLTVACGPNRSFLCGLSDRGAWAIAAMIPLMAFGPMKWRMQTGVPGKPTSNGDPQLDYARDLRDNTAPSDVILTNADSDQRGFALPWYTDRAILTYEGTGPNESDTRTAAGIDKLRDAYKDRRILYFVAQRPAADKALEEVLAKYPKQAAGQAVVYVINNSTGAPATITPATKPVPATSKPAPVTVKPAVATTKPAPLSSRPAVVTTKAATRPVTKPAP